MEEFIEIRQKQLERWQEEEASVSRCLEEIRMEASALGQKKDFAARNISRVEEELNRLASELKEVEEHLAGDALDIEEKKRISKRYVRRSFRPGKVRKAKKL